MTKTRIGVLPYYRGAWKNTETYGLDNRVTDANGDYYTSLKDDNLNHALTDTAWWGKLTYTNEGNMAASAASAANTAAANAKADYVGDDNYVYRWDRTTGAYVKTSLYVKGDKGDTGAQGKQGEKGETGATGATGAKMAYADLTVSDKTDLASYNGIPLTSVAATDGGTVTLQPNHFHKITCPDAGGAITIALAAPSDTTKAVDYDGEITVGTTVPTITWDSNLTWQHSAPTLVASTRYEFSIRYDGEKYYIIMI